MNREKRALKPYHGAILTALAAADVFWLSKFLGERFGLYGTAMHELLLLLLAVGTAWIFGGDLKRVFSFQRPKWSKIAGTLILWLGTFWGVMLLTMAIAYFFPQQMLGTGAGLGQAFTSVPFLISILIVSVTPAVCEEAVFRGTLLNSLRGSVRGKWTLILIVSVIFGLFHGSIWRFVPTALLGVTLSYLVVETDNMFYNMLFHAVNNAVPVIALYALKGIMGPLDLGTLTEQTMQIDSIPLLSVSSYLMYGGAAPFLIYIGSYLLHRGDTGYRKELFPRDKRGVLAALIAIGLLAFAASVCITLYALFFQNGLPPLNQQYNQYL